MFNENRPSLKHEDYGKYIGSMIKQEPIRTVPATRTLSEPEPDQLSRAEGDGFVDRRFNPNRQPSRSGYTTRNFDEASMARAEGEGMVARSTQLRPGRAVVVSR